jgi:hypothetical protein
MRKRATSERKWMLAAPTGPRVPKHPGQVEHHAAIGDRVGEHKRFAVDGEVYVAQHIEIEVVVAMMMSASRTLPDFSWMPVCVNISISLVTTRCLAGADLL